MQLRLLAAAIPLIALPALAATPPVPLVFGPDTAPTTGGYPVVTWTNGKPYVAYYGGTPNGDVSQVWGVFTSEYWPVMRNGKYMEAHGDHLTISNGWAHFVYEISTRIIEQKSDFAYELRADNDGIDLIYSYGGSGDWLIEWPDSGTLIGAFNGQHDANPHMADGVLVFETAASGSTDRYIEVYSYTNFPRNASWQDKWEFPGTDTFNANTRDGDIVFEQAGSNGYSDIQYVPAGSHDPRSITWGVKCRSYHSPILGFKGDVVLFEGRDCEDGANILYLFNWPTMRWYVVDKVDAGGSSNDHRHYDINEDMVTWGYNGKIFAAQVDLGAL